MITELISSLMGKRSAALFIQFFKFSLVGVSNFIIDASVLNLLSFTTKIYSGLPIALFNVISFSIAVTSSYAMNKRWVFRDPLAPGTKKFSKFIGIYIGGNLLNTGVVLLLTSFFLPPGFTPQIWLNIAKIIALPPSTAWNFFGVRFFVFRSKHDENKTMQDNAATAIEDSL
jgi:putative flippase GtrA